MVTLADLEHIVTAWAEKASGPGWSNFPIWVLIIEPMGTYRLECIQPEEQTDEMRTLFKVSALVAEQMTALVRAAAKKEE